MNREERRNLEKNGVDKETIQKLNQYDKPCTILETIKIARAVAEDVASESLEDYRKRSTGTIVALTLQLEILKNLVIEKGLITEESFMEKYEVSAKEFEDKQRDYLNAMKEAEAQRLQDEETSQDIEEKKSDVQFATAVNPVELKKEKRGSEDGDQ